MKYSILIAALFFVGFAQEKSHSSILVIIEGIQENKGQIVITVYNNKNGFPTKPEVAYKQYIAPIKNLKSELWLENLPTGEYAISVFQDENTNKKFDMNFFNVPVEKVGVSNNPKVFFIPSYEDAKFLLTEKSIRQTIKIK